MSINPMPRTFVQVVSKDSQFNQSLISTIDSISDCNLGISEDWWKLQSQFKVLIALISADNPQSIKAAQEWFRCNKTTLKEVEVILIADKLEFDVQREFLSMGATILENPVNMHRLRYLIDHAAVSNRNRPPTASTELTSNLGRKVSKAAMVSSNILLTGETGVGKTYLAKKIHLASQRAKKKFVVVNCANLSQELFESELFGHAKSAFTGADKKRIGQLEHAGGGTVFLDEIDSLPKSCQAKLLHVVETKEFRPVGENRLVEFKARIISASNQDLDLLGSQGAFRSDLHFRINTYELKVPSLRERLDYIEQYCHQFADEFSCQNGVVRPAFSVSLFDQLRRYAWPGNLRELRNCVHHCAIDSDDNIIRFENLPHKIKSSLNEQAAQASSTRAVRVDSAHGYEELRLTKALQNNNFNRSRTAKELGVSRMTVYNMMKRHGIG